MTQGTDIRERDQPGRRPRRVTAADVADHAGVSRSAVSRAFTEGAYLDDDKRARILNAAMHLGYHPNAMAAAMTGARSNLIAVFSGTMSSDYDSALLSHLVEALNAAEKWPVLLSGDPARPEDALLSILRYPLDALIVRGGSVSPALLDSCLKLNIPVIVSGHVTGKDGTDCVSRRNELSARMATELLLERGRQRFAYIGGPADWFSEHERLSSVQTCLARQGLDLIAMTRGDYTYRGGRDAARDIFARGAEINALICANDSMALGALSHLRHEAGIDVPGAVSVIGFDDIEMASWPEFDLTTVRNPIDETVREILRLLEDRLTRPEKPREVALVEPILQLRGTH